MSEEPRSSATPSPVPSPPERQPSLLSEGEQWHGRFPRPPWVPAESDKSQQAIDWRASTGLRVARRAEFKHDTLAPEVRKLTGAVGRATKAATWITVIAMGVWVVNAAQRVLAFVVSLRPTVSQQSTHTP